MDEFDEVTAGTTLYACRRCGVVMVEHGCARHAERHDDEDVAFDMLGGPIPPRA